MKQTAAKVLSFKEICAIIKTCGASGVHELKFGELSITLHPRAQSNDASQIHIINRQVETKYPRTALTGGEEIPVQTDEETQRIIDDFKRAQDLINDPESHEEEMISQAMSGSVE